MVAAFKSFLCSPRNFGEMMVLNWTFAYIFDWVGKQPPTRMGFSGFLRKDDLENLRGLPNGWNFSFFLSLDMFFFLKVGDVKHPFLLLHYICTWNPHDMTPVLIGEKGPSFGGLEPQE